MLSRGAWSHHCAILWYSYCTNLRVPSSVLRMDPNLSRECALLSGVQELMTDPLHHQAHHRAHPTHVRELKTTPPYRAGLLVHIVPFLIPLPLFQNWALTGKNDPEVNNKYMLQFSFILNLNFISHCFQCYYNTLWYSSTNYEEKMFQSQHIHVFQEKLQEIDT